MGGGVWSTEDYEKRAAEKASKGEATFAHTERMSRVPASERKAHETLDPHGVLVRESCDSKEHPESTAVSVWFDMTGSMGGIPVTLQKKLKNLLGMVLRKGYLANPQIMFGAIGDATVDSVPLQVGQFESDNRMDENLENLFLEGGGGPGNRESYELAMYFMARKTKIDCLKKRGKKGYLFIIADEIAYDQVNKNQVASIIGDGLQEDIPIKDIVSELEEKYEVYLLFPSSGTSYADDEEHHDYWKKLFPQRFFLVDPEDMTEMIASIIGKREGVFDDSDILGHLKEVGAGKETIEMVKGFLPKVEPKKEIAATSGTIPGLA